MRKALLVGINEYPQIPLKGCINDVNAVEQAISKNEDQSPNFEIRKELNIQTKAELRQAIELCFKGASDIALFYYSGHGFLDTVGGYLVTPDFSQGDYGVSMNDILSFANESPARNKVIILDCCCSGNMGSISTAGQNTAMISDGVTILTSCKSDENASELDGHGIFTSLLVEALNGGAADLLGNITLGGIYAFIDKSLGAWDQRPVFKTNITSFTPIKKVNPPVSLETLRVIRKLFDKPDAIYKLNPSYEPTNSPDVEHIVLEPYADESNVKTFKNLQKLESVGIVVPDGSPHMYFAAMKSLGCRLTTTGKYYWSLIDKNRI